MVLSVFFGSTIFLTLSRGAIFAYGIAFIILTILIVIKKSDFLRLFKNAAIAITAFIIATFSQGLFSALSPVSIDFFTGVSVYINQLSLGIIDLKSLTATQSASDDRLTIPTEAIVENSNEQDNSADFDGYIEASTDVRVTLSAFSLDLWSKNPNNLLFGVGYGGAGVSLQKAQEQKIFSTQLYNKYPNWIINELFSTPKQIVQNEYVSILLELGVLGFILFGIVISYTIKIFKKQNKMVLIISLLTAYGISFFFLSGFTNVFHVYLLIPIFYFAIPPSPESNIKKSPPTSATQSTL